MKFSEYLNESLKQKGSIPKGWTQLQKGKFGDDAVMWKNKWFALYERNGGTAIGRPPSLKISIYEHREYTSRGVKEHRLIVGDDNLAKED